MRKLLVGIFSVAMLAGWVRSDRTAPASGSTTSATTKRWSHDDDNKPKTICPMWYQGYLIYYQC
jgi:hypothetical protein